MAVKIRLRRMGGTNDPFYRIVATDERSANCGRFLEQLGWYDPKKPENNLKVDLDRLHTWVANGAILTDTVRSLMKKAEKAVPFKATGEPVEEPAAEEAVSAPVAAEAPAE